MGKLILISGPNGSGKSRFAERLAGRCDGPRFYIATMVPQTEENLRRIEAHRAQRAGLQFRTLELPRGIDAAPVEEDSAVLLEDVSNLLANAMFEDGGTAERVFAEICALRDRCASLTAVTISGLSPEGYTGETLDYIRALDRLNRLLLDAADAAAVMEDRRPRVIKGDLDGIL